MLSKLADYNRRFADAPRGEDEGPIWNWIDRRSRVVFSAPHSTRSFVYKKEKAADLYTGAIAMFLSETTGFSSLTRLKYVPRKERMVDFVGQSGLESHYFLDIHGMNSNNVFELAVGTGLLPTGLYEREISVIRTLATKYGIVWVLNHPAYHGLDGFISKYQERYGKKNVLQLELRTDMRNFYDHSENVIKKTIPFLTELAHTINGWREISL